MKMTEQNHNFTPKRITFQKQCVQKNASPRAEVNPHDPPPSQ
jgi:hypothetical protein